MAVIHQAVFAVKNMELILSNAVGRRRNTKDTRWTYYAKEAAVPGEVYQFGEEWFYVPVDENDLKTKLSFWDASDAPTEQVILDKPVKANHILTTNITTMESMFRDAAAFNQNIEGWDTSNVTDMGYMFAGAASFNQDIGGWDVRNVVNMDSMFENASAFNQDLSSWRVIEIPEKPDNFDHNTDAWDKTGRLPAAWNTYVIPEDFIPIDKLRNASDTGWIYYAKGTVVLGEVYEFEGEWYYVAVDRDDLEDKLAFWNSVEVPVEQYIKDKPITANRIITTLVDDMSYMFAYGSVFNQDISGWDTYNVRDMEGMFYGAAAFDQDIGGWDVSNVADMSYMFKDATVFDQDLSNWRVEMPEPDGFDENTPGWNKSGRQPVWSVPDEPVAS